MPNVRPSTSKYSHRYPLQAYLHVLSGCTEQEVAGRLGVSEVTLKNWKHKKPEFREAIELGREHHKARSGGSLRDHIFGLLPPELQKVWERLELCEHDPERSQGYLDRLPELDLKRLFVHALAASHFDYNQACHRLHVSRRRLELWQEDVDFLELMETVQWHKKNFVEGAFMGKIQEGDTQAIIHANKTLNKDRGYGESKEINKNVNKTETVIHKTYTIAQLDLPVEVLELMLQRVRTLGNGSAPSDQVASEVVEVVPVIGFKELPS